MIEYKIREVTRYIVTRWEGEKAGQNSLLTQLNHGVGTQYNPLTGQIIPAPVQSPSRSSQHGEFDNADQAYAVAYALCKTEHDKLGFPPGDDRIQYPEPPKGVTGEGMRF